MPKRTNKYAGIKQQLDGRWFARAYFQRKEYSKEFSTQGAALKWRDQLLSDLRRCPQSVIYEQGLWKTELTTPTGLEKFENEILDAVINWRIKTQGQIESGVWQDPALRDMTLANFLPTFRKARGTASGKTWAGYNSALRRYLCVFNDVRLIDLKPMVIQHWINELAEDGVGPAAIRAAHGTLRNILGVAVHHGYLEHNPALRLKLPPKTPRKMRALTIEELHNLADKCGKQSLFIRFTGHCGLRFGEVTALRVKHLNVVRSEVLVESAWTTDASGRRVLSDPKTKRSRTVPVPREIMKRVVQQVESKNPEDFVFSGEKGGPIDYGVFRKTTWNSATKSAGLDEITFHDLRHTSASLLIRLGTPVNVVSEILGHSSTKMTLDVYGHYYEGDAARWMQALEDQFVPSQESRTEQERNSQQLRALG